MELVTDQTKILKSGIFPGDIQHVSRRVEVRRVSIKLEGGNALEQRPDTAWQVTGVARPSPVFANAQINHSRLTAFRPYLLRFFLHIVGVDGKKAGWTPGVAERNLKMGLNFPQFSGSSPF